MMFRTLALSLLLMAQGAEAFKPAAFLAKTTPVGNSNGWRAPMNTNMVAGGAERSQSEDYYEGEFFLRYLRSRYKIYAYAGHQSE